MKKIIYIFTTSLISILYSTGNTSPTDKLLEDIREARNPLVPYVTVQTKESVNYDLFQQYLRKKIVGVITHPVEGRVIMSSRTIIVGEQIPIKKLKDLQSIALDDAVMSDTLMLVAIGGNGPKFRMENTQQTFTVPVPSLANNEAIRETKPLAYGWFLTNEGKALIVYSRIENIPRVGDHITVSSRLYGNVKMKVQQLTSSRCIIAKSSGSEVIPIPMGELGDAKARQLRILEKNGGLSKLPSGANHKKMDGDITTILKKSPIKAITRNGNTISAFLTAAGDFISANDIIGALEEDMSTNTYNTKLNLHQHILTIY